MSIINNVISFGLGLIITFVFNLVGNTKNLGFWDVKKSTKMKRLEDGTFKAMKRFFINDKIEYKVIANKSWDNVEKGIFAEDIQNHNFEAIKGHYEDIFVHSFNK